MPAPDASVGYDGAQWILEAVRGDRYHVVDRWGGGAMEEPALRLVELSTLKVEDVY